MDELSLKNDNEDNCPIVSTDGKRIMQLDYRRAATYIVEYTTAYPTEPGDGHVSLRILDPRLMKHLCEDTRACDQFAEMLIERVAEAIDEHLAKRQAK